MKSSTFRPSRGTPRSARAPAASASLGVAQAAGRGPQGQRRLGLRAEGKLSLKDFGIAWNQPIEGGFALGDTVHVRLNLEAVARAA